MRKGVIAIAGVFIIAVLGIYIVIPGNISIFRSVVVPCKINAVKRYLLNDKQWVKWWPGENTVHQHASPQTNASFVYNKYNYHIRNLYYNKIEILTRNDAGLSTVGFIDIFDLNNDSVAIQWQENIQTSANPFKRFGKYNFAEDIKNNMVGILSGMSAFLGNKNKVYATDINEVVIKDTILMSSTSYFKNRPEMKQAYQAIEKVESYIKSKGAKKTGYPILNISPSANNTFMLMVAIPIDEAIEDYGGFKLKRMPRTRILEARIKGGPSAISNAFSEMQIFSTDYHLGSSAIPFESLITNRLSEPDTSKWVTRLYFPIY